MAFQEVRLPARLAFGSTGGVERRTEITTLGSGFEGRSTPWAEGRRRYLIGGGVAVAGRHGGADGHFRGGGRRLTWVARVRTGGDRWDQEPAEVDPRRFRVRVLDDGVEKRVWEVEGMETVYAAGQMSADFPGGVGDGARVAVAQWGEGYGWGAEAVARLL
jgi:hypothetical protein